MSSILKVDQLQDSGGNSIISSNGSGTFTPGSLNIANAQIASNAAIATSKLGTGAVLQVVQQGQTTGYASSSTSFSDVISKSITPISSSSTILVRFQTRVYMPTLGMEHEVKLLRDSTGLEVYRGAWHTGSGTTARREIWEYFDTSHGTTSSITYKFQQRCGSTGSVQINPNAAADGIYYLTLMEIAG